MVISAWYLLNLAVYLVDPCQNYFIILQKWTDLRLTWDTEETGITSLAVPPQMLWKPDIGISSNVDNVFKIFQGDERLVLRSNGTITWSPTGILLTYCTSDFEFFPFDEQSCEVQVESMISPVEIQDMVPGEDPNFTIRQRVFVKNGVWDIIGNSTNKCKTLSFWGDPGTYSCTIFKLNIRRKPLYHILYIVCPSTLVVATQLIVYFLPIKESTNRIAMLFSCLLSFLIFQQVTIQETAKKIDKVPMLSKFLQLQMCYIAFAIFCEGAIALLYRGSETKEPPKIILIVSKKLGRWLLVPKKYRDLSKAPPVTAVTSTALALVSKTLVRRTVSSEHQRPPTKIKGHREWFLIASVFEHIVAVVYTLAVIFTPVVMFYGFVTYRVNVE